LFKAEEIRGSAKLKTILIACKSTRKGDVKESCRVIGMDYEAIAQGNRLLPGVVAILEYFEEGIPDGREKSRSADDNQETPMYYLLFRL
jgi:hypothetical protein